MAKHPPFSLAFCYWLLYSPRFGRGQVAWITHTQKVKSAFSGRWNYLMFNPPTDVSYISTMKAYVLENPQRPFFQLLGLSGRLIEPHLKVRAAVLPSHIDGLFSVGRHDDEL